MAKKVFISYSHAQQNWVRTRLVPVLDAGGADALIDYREFGAGKRVIGQMDDTQDRADQTLLVLSPQYLASDYCLHEMNRALKNDPQFKEGSVLPVIKETCTLPDWLTRSNPDLPLYVNLTNGKDTTQWDLLLKACDADLGVTAPDWLKTRDEICLYLQRNESVNLVVRGKYIKWRELLRHIRQEWITDLGEVDLESGAVASRRAFVSEMLKAAGAATPVPPKPDDLVILNHALTTRSQKTRLILKHFDYVTFHPYYDHNLFATLRHLIMESQKLVLLIHSKKSFIELLPLDNPLSSITNLKTVELRDKP